jgi:hypothetical protein
VIDDDDPIGELVGLIQVLRGQQQRHALGDQPPDHVPHPHPAGRIQTSRRLVEEQHRRAHDQAGGQVQPTAHAAAVGLGHPFGGIEEVKALEQLARSCPGLAAAELRS